MSNKPQSYSDETESREIELKPCPFCGNEHPELIHVTWATPNSYLVRCRCCGATSSGDGVRNGYHSFYSMTQAINSWNMRAAKDVLEELSIMRQDMASVKESLGKLIPGWSGRPRVIETNELLKCVLDHGEYVLTNTDGKYIATIIADEDSEHHETDAVALSLIPKMLELIDEAQHELSLASGIVNSVHIDDLLNKIDAFFDKHIKRERGGP